MLKPVNHQRVLYAKGGHAIEEAARLFPCAGTPPTLGPDQFLLAARYAFSAADFRLVSVGPETRRRKFLNGEALEYGLRPARGTKVQRVLAQAIGTLRFFSSSLLWRPTLILGGIEGPMSVAGLWVARLLRARFIFLVHTDLSPASLSGSKLALNRHVARRADAVIVHGPFLRDKLLKLGCAADCLLEFDTGFDPSALIDVTRNSTKPPCKTDAFLYAGRIEANKGVFDLLNAFESIAADSEVRLVFAGEGGDLKGLRQQAAASIYSDRIAVLGAVAHAELLQMMQAALATVTPTQSRFPEGRCMSAMESLLVGTPVIAPEYGPFPYLVNHCENGLLYAPDRVPSLAAAMRRLINEPGLSVQLQSGAARSGAELMTPRHSFVSRLLEASR